jgi:hypothetical protein
VDIDPNRLKLMAALSQSLVLCALSLAVARETPLHGAVHGSPSSAATPLPLTVTVTDSDGH